MKHKIPLILLGIIIALIIYSVILTFVFDAYGALECVDLRKPLQHIHVIVTPPFPDGVGIPPYLGGTDECIREMHTHFDANRTAGYGFIHLESNNLTKTFTLPDFLDLINKTAMDYSGLTINGEPAGISTTLRDQDKIVLK